MDDLHEFADEAARAAARLTGHTQKDWTVLAQASATTLSWAPRIASHLMGSIAANPASAQFVSEDLEQRESNLASWLGNVVTGEPSRVFWAECTLIGLAHVAAGVPAGMVVAGAAQLEEIFLAHCMTSFAASDALRLHAAFHRIVATAVAVMTNAGDDAVRDAVNDTGLDRGRFQERLRRNVQSRVREERARMPQLDWGPALSVGVSNLDEQHKQLFALLNEFHQASSDEREESLLREVLDELLDYTRIHFAYEETLLAKHGYPELPSHRAAHAKLAERVAHFVEAAQFGAGPLGFDLYFFLRTWLNGHIRGSDRKYGSFLNQHGVI